VCTDVQDEEKVRVSWLVCLERMVKMQGWKDKEVETGSV
jgi:hypothetical protein